MRKKYIFGKKLYISILTTILVLLTTVATTFAWVGVFANSTFDTFDIGIKVSSLDEYSIQISTTGLKDSFSDTVDIYDIKKQILINWGYPKSLFDKEDEKGNIINNEANIDIYFTALQLDQCTNTPIINETNNQIEKLSEFRILENNSITKKYFKFDIYISTIKNYNSDEISNFNLEVYLGENMLKGTKKNRLLFNSFTYPSTFLNPNILQENSNLRNVVGSEKIVNPYVDSKSAARVGFEKYEVVDKNHPEQYSNLSSPKSAIIFTGDAYNYPTYNESQNLYEFGAILPDEINFATEYWNSSEYRYAHNAYRVLQVPSSLYEIRGVGSKYEDKVLNKFNNHLIDSTNPDEQIGVNQMMKVTCYFWFEGWDADCFSAINAAPVTIKMMFNMSNEDE